nr:MAG TPA: hypothetical protein [Caudoviricetes sp.]
MCSRMRFEIMMYILSRKWLRSAICSIINF